MRRTTRPEPVTVVATGHLNREQPLEIGERVEIAGRAGIVRTIEPTLGGRELRLVVLLTHTPGHP